jgi:hypothetical protein
MAQKIYYKLLAVKNKQLYSHISYSRSDNPCGIRYKVNKWIKPKIKNSKLFVFDNLFSLRKYNSGMAKHTVYKCEVENPEYCKKLSLVYKDAIMNFWNGSNTVNTMTPPYGTIECDAVKITKRVKGY